MGKILLTLLIYLSLSNLCFANNSAVKINEIMANPKGKDEGKEWIELYNTSNEIINLENWIISNPPDKNFEIKKTKINPKSHIVIKSKITLQNKENTIALLNSESVLIDQITYAKPQEGQSYSHISIKSKDTQKSTWQNSIPSPKSQNPILYELSGFISKEPTIAKNYYFEINDKQKIIFDKEDFNFKELAQILKKNQFIEIRAKKQSKYFQLEEYRIKTIPNQSDKKKSDHSKTITLIILITSLLIIQLSKKKRDKAYSPIPRVSYSQPGQKNSLRQQCHFPSPPQHKKQTNQ